MPKPEREITILMADDDEDDRMLVQDAFDSLNMRCRLLFVVNGDELMDYLHHRSKYSDPKGYPRPDIILLDLNMPQKSGLEALKEIRSDHNFKLIAVLILSTTTDKEQIEKSYALGANAYIAKPISFERLVQAIEAIRKFWFDVSELPPNDASNERRDAV